MWLPVAIVFLGGGLGAITREFSMLLLHPYSSAFPLDIFSANIVASFLLGLVFGLHQAGRASADVILFVGTGFTGGMSTFSTFIYGSYSEMMTPGRLPLAVFYVLSSLIIGYGITWLGLKVATQLRCNLKAGSSEAQ